MFISSVGLRSAFRRIQRRFLPISEASLLAQLRACTGNPGEIARDAIDSRGSKRFCLDWVVTVLRSAGIAVSSAGAIGTGRSNLRGAVRCGSGLSRSDGCFVMDFDARINLSAVGPIILDRVWAEGFYLVGLLFS